jgi:hypothetical protein
MRFTAQGPSIPNELLVARELGDVVLFCGAGVSRAEAGLPNFADLGRDVVRRLGAAQDSRARLLLDRALALAPLPGVGGLVATDRVFGLLEQEFETRDVREAVAAAIHPGPDAKLGAHRVLLDLATSRGVTRLVTTNFDLLFEACDPALRSSGPPNLPDPRSEREFQGVVHLHGRVDEAYRTAQDDEFVVSTSDFGRAYLAEGWATRFIRSLLSRFTILFVGYSADDPPVQYLLEGLNLRAGTRNRLYALQDGEQHNAVALWEHRGVQAIPFDPRDRFQHLWDTLRAWADRARDERAWRQALLARAASGPQSLAPYQRGQVVHLLSTTEGARQVAAAKDPLGAEWLLVADPRQRYATPSRWVPCEKDGPPLDAFEFLGTDDDPIPEPANPEDIHRNRSVPDDALDVLRPSTLDAERQTISREVGIVGHPATFNAALPPRLESIRTWIRRVAHQPAALWWAAHQAALHPSIVEDIRVSLLQNTERFPEAIRLGWRRLLAARADLRRDPSMLRFDIERQARHEGWSHSLVREVTGLYRPKLAVKPAHVMPHPTAWASSDPGQDVVQASVDYPAPHEGIEVPEAFLPYAVECFRANLDLAVALEREISGSDGIYLQTTRGSDGGSEPSEDSYGVTGPLVGFQKLMARFAAVDPSAARRQALSWPPTDEYVYARLRIWAAGSGLLDTGEAATIFRSLPERVFWGHTHARDLLFALRDRWRDLSVDDRRALEDRLLTGSFLWSEGVPGGVEQAVALDRLSRLHWLSRQGVTFSFDVDKAIRSLQAIAPSWTTRMGDAAADSNVPEVFSVATDSRPDPLFGVPLADLLSRATDLGRIDFAERVEREPFHGLAAHRPARALGALTLSARAGQAPRWAWSAFLTSEARADDLPRMVRAIACRLSSLPAAALLGIAYPVTEWMRAAASRLYGDAPDVLSGLWESLITALRSSDVKDGHAHRRSWADEFLNSPVGKIFEFLMKAPFVNHTKAGQGLPSDWTLRIEDLLFLPCDLRRHALVGVGYHATWLFVVDRDWTAERLLPVARDEGADGDALWAGLMWAARVPSEEFYPLLKEAMLARARGQLGRRGEATVLAGFLLLGWGREDARGRRIVTDEELREVLIHSDDEFRQQLLWQLERWCSEAGDTWRAKVVPFFRNVWPRQRALHTPAMSSHLANFALASGDLMPEVAEVILPRLVSVRNLHLRSAMVDRTSGEAQAPMFPLTMLDILSAVLGEDVSLWPQGTETTLDRLAKAPETSGDPRLSELRRRLQRG